MKILKRLGLILTIFFLVVLNYTFLANYFPILHLPPLGFGHMEFNNSTPIFSQIPKDVVFFTHMDFPFLGSVAFILLVILINFALIFSIFYFLHNNQRNNDFDSPLLKAFKIGGIILITFFALIINYVFLSNNFPSLNLPTLIMISTAHDVHVYLSYLNFPFLRSAGFIALVTLFDIGLISLMLFFFYKKRENTIFIHSSR